MSKRDLYEVYKKTREELKDDPDFADPEKQAMLNELVDEAYQEMLIEEGLVNQDEAPQSKVTPQPTKPSNLGDLLKPIGTKPVD
jgi:hypothetical protein